MWKRIGITVAVGTLFAATLGGAAVATTDVAPPTDAPSGVEDTFGEDGAFGEDDWELSDEDIAEMNAETDGLVEYLSGLGFDVTVETDDEGFRYPNFGEEDDALMAAIDGYYQAQFTDEVASWSDAQKAEWNADIDAFIADLASQGITATKVEIISGLYDIDWTDELDAAFGESEDGFDGQPSAQEVAEINADTGALVDHLKSLGFDVKVETDEYGVRYPVLDDDLDSAVYEAINDYYEATFADEVASWSDEEKAEWNASIDELVADLATQGVTADTVEIAPGVYDVDWTEELEGELMGSSDDGFEFPEPPELLEEDAA